jgi:hypothetical protein
MAKEKGARRPLLVLFRVRRIATREIFAFFTVTTTPAARTQMEADTFTFAHILAGVWLFTARHGDLITSGNAHGRCDECGQASIRLFIAFGAIIKARLLKLLTVGARAPVRIIVTALLIAVLIRI